ncbi:MAG TPA: PP2C family protein-serine/threonine phosphatase [Bacteroidia bacterium]|jgi:sigma-B regulation protein RsbU (phosphoserine phosphatase)|nr:PP2C family protein-serine/threonine phosphatase [Bacteroidia bacterium]
MAEETPGKPVVSRPKIKDIKLNSILEVTKAINNNFSTEKLLEIFEEVLRSQLSIGKLILFSYDEGWKCLLKYGVEDELAAVDVQKEFGHIKEISTLDYTSSAAEHTFEIVVPVYHKASPLAYVLIGDLNEDKLEVSAAIKHLPFVQTLANIIMVAIENKKLAKENIRQAAMRKELELASEMQNMLFPSKLPNNGLLQIAAYYLPHQQVGGDYYDFIQLDENEVAFCMADVSGKGVPAALLMSNFQANLRILLNSITSLSDLVKELNTKVIQNAKGEKFITLFIARYNIVTRILTYINAGHNPPLLGTENSISMLKVGCTGLGMFDELTKVKEGVVSIDPGSVILCYTDGVVEIENDQSEEFGVHSLKETLRTRFADDMESLNNSIIADVIKYKGLRPYVDDIALFSCRIF